MSVWHMLPYVPGFYAVKPAVGLIPYKGWLISLLHLSLAMTFQNLVLWWLIRQILMVKRPR